MSNALFGALAQHDRSSAATALAEAAWIRVPENDLAAPGRRPAYELRTTFIVGRPENAWLSATAHGIYEAFVNGVRVGDDELAPGASSYQKTLYVQRYDVTDLLQPGLNEVRFILSDGWFRGRCGARRQADNYGTSTALLGQLIFEDDGHPRLVATRDDWEWSEGPIVAADLMDGQSMDLRLIDRPRSWQPVVEAIDDLTSDRDRLAFSPAPAVRRTDELKPVAITIPRPGRQLVDFGQNISGWVRLRQLGASGALITLTHGEALDHTGDLTMANLEYTPYPEPNALPTGQIDRVISRGDASDVFEPRHTTHGFRYVAIDGLEEPLNPEMIVAVLVRSELARTGEFSSSDDRVNRLHAMAVASWDANSCDLPTDCPQRERWGYTGDYQIFVRSAAFIDDVLGFSRKWLQALSDDQLENGCITNVAPDCGTKPTAGMPISFNGSAGWGDAATVVPWQLYESYGDPAVLIENYDMMSRWVDYASGIAELERHPERAQSRPEPAEHERYLWDSGFHWGEWAEPNASFDPFADKGIIATAYLSRSARIVADAADILGRTADVERYRAIETGAANAWRTEYLARDGALRLGSQANYVRGLAFDLFPEEWRQAAVTRLVDMILENGTRLSTGFLSTAYLLPVLAMNGRAEIAFDLLFQHEEPSWFAMLDRGATTVWESWSGIDAEGIAHDSLNHYSKGAVISFLHEFVAGIRPDASRPGYERFTVRPILDPRRRLETAVGRLRTNRGTIRSEWRIERSSFKLEVDVPPGATAAVVLPSGATHELEAGSHAFEESLV